MQSSNGSGSDTGILSPGLARAWGVLLLLPEYDLRKRPGSALAEVLGFTRQAASKAILALRKIGLVGPGKGRSLWVRRPTPRFDPARFEPEPEEQDPSPDREPVCQLGFPETRLTMFLETLQFQTKLGNEIFLSCSSVAKLQEEQPKIFDVGKSGLAARKKLASEVAKALKSIRTGRDPGGRPRLGPDVDVDFFVESYVSRRARIEPLYQIGFGETASLAEAVKGLRAKRIPRSYWADFLDHVFEVFRAITSGRADVPPASFVKSDKVIGNWSAEHGPRKRDLVKARNLLRANGFGDTRPGVVLSFTLDVEKDPKVLRTITPARYQEAVAFLFSRLPEIGYAEKDPDEVGA